MDQRVLGEFMGTLVLILMGNGVVANVLLRKSKGEGSGWIVITAGWAFAVMSGVFTAIACGGADANLNPAGKFNNYQNFGGQPFTPISNPSMAGLRQLGVQGTKK